METLSVIIPAYQAEKYLAEAVQSVRSQNWPGKLEIIIVDDGSSDETFTLAKELGDYAWTKKRGGAASARNMGLHRAAGEFIFLLDADDRLTFNAFAELYAPFSQCPELEAVFSLARDFASPELNEEQKKKLRIRKESYGGVLPGCALIRKKVFEKIGFFDEDLQSGETIAWQIKLRESGLPCTLINTVTLERRLHLFNTGRVDPKKEMQNYAAILRKRMSGK